MIKNTKKVLCLILTFAIAVCCIAIYISYNKERKEKAEYYKTVSAQMAGEEEQEREEREALKQKDSFYQKLSDGFDVNILVVGDSIGKGTGASSQNTNWTKLLTSRLKRSYHGYVRLKNISFGGNTSYAGYTSVKTLDSKTDYDLVIICYGENDGDDNFGKYYESIIRAVRARNSRCSVISILESAQKEYTQKMQTIKGLAQHYGIGIADTIKPFTDNSNGAYENLTADGVHPNDKGYKIYADVIEAVINEKVEAYEPYNDADIAPMFADAIQFDNLKDIPLKEFKREDNTFTYTLNTPITGILGMDFTFAPGEYSYEIFVDGNSYYKKAWTFDHDFRQRRLFITKDSYVTANKTIKIVFNNKDQADGFGGLYFSSEK